MTKFRKRVGGKSVFVGRASTLDEARAMAREARDAPASRIRDPEQVRQSVVHKT
jgi:hypothetical protein